MFQTNYFGNIGHFFYQAILKPFGRRHKALADFVLLIIHISICQVLCVRMHQREHYGRQNNSDHRFEPWLSTWERVHVTFSTPTFCTRFVNAKSLAINKKCYFILSALLPSLAFSTRPLNLLMRPSLNDLKISTNVKW